MQGDPAHLAERGLLPPLWSGGFCGLNLRAGVDYTSACRDALPGVALGDALGRPGEGGTSSATQGRYGELRYFHPWRGWQRGPKGTITDDTQATTCPTRSIVGRGRLDPEDLAHPIADWLDYGQGRACPGGRPGSAQLGMGRPEGLSPPPPREPRLK